MNNVALITGASSGIGLELAHLHAATGSDVILTARRAEKLKELQQTLEAQHGVQVRVFPMDLSVPGAGRQLYDAVKEAGITVEYLINNAGFGGRGKFHERDWAQDLAMINLNVVALTELTRLFLPEMVQRNAGKILNVSSTASLIPGPLQAVYYATKAYVTSFSNALAEELHDTRVTVTALLPGATETEFAATSGMDKTDLFNQTASARKVAEDGYQGMLKGALNVKSGMSGGQKAMMALLPLLPKKVVLKQIRTLQEVKD